MEMVKFNGWKNSVRLSNKDVELVVTKDVGPRVIRFGFIGERNVFAEYKDQQGKMREKEWMIRGGHRFWIAPEEKPKTYELDNSPIEIERTKEGIRTIQAVGPLSGIQKTMEISLARKTNNVKIVHTLKNMKKKSVTVAPWALSVMAPGGMAIIPLPKKIPHTDRLTHNQQWSLWGYTDLGDPRWMFGSQYIFFRQDIRRGPNKLGIAHQEGWAAYQLDSYLFVKRFKWIEGADYPDGGCNFETFSNEDMLEVESLGPLVTLGAGQTTSHEERWSLHRKVPVVRTEADVDLHIRKLL
jgi:hypothetical protein